MSPLADSRARTTAAVLTPVGRGAVAIIGIRGPRAASALQQFFRGHKDLETAPERRLLYGQWQRLSNASAPAAQEDIVLTRYATHWELGCHGGAIAAQTILHDLGTQDVTRIDWQEWLYDAGHRRLEVSHQIALAHAVSPAAAMALLRALPATEQALHDLREMCAHWLNTRDDQRRVSLLASIDQLLATARWAWHLTQPWHITLAGPPNAGKSSLLNALVGYERAIVFDQPGTTRDVVTAAAAHDGWRWELHDTAGLRETTDELEIQGIDRTQATLQASELRLLVLDGGADPAHSAELRARYRDALMVRNKADLWPNRTNELGGATVTADSELTVSAKTGQGLEALRVAIQGRLAVPTWSAIGACVWDPALEHDLRTVQQTLAADPLALPVALAELQTWIRTPAGPGNRADNLGHS